jgi:hypothetical protein
VRVPGTKQKTLDGLRPATNLEEKHMAKLINSLNQGRRNVTPGERRFAKRLETLLEDDYLCWFDVPIGPARHYPDFLILHPSRGLLLLEVKDWKLDTLTTSTRSMPTSISTARSRGLRIRWNRRAAIR